MEIMTLLVTQCPVLGALIWFLVTNTRESNRRFEEQGKQFQLALDKIVEKIGDKIDNLENRSININLKKEDDV
jgi:Flp pilus assembly protein TadB